MVVYSKQDTFSARDEEPTPFSLKSRCAGYNDSYSYLLLQCKKKGIKAAFTTSKDIIGPGLFQSFWTFDKKWIKHECQAYSETLFDKFSPTTDKQKNRLRLLTASKSITTFSNRKMKTLFQNKLYTYKEFKKIAIPSVEITSSSLEDIKEAKVKLDSILQDHENSEDFSDKYILKDNLGAGGFKIYKIDFAKSGFEKIIEHYKENQKEKSSTSFVLQPFINCEKGFVFNEYNGFIDLRIILMNNKILQTYIRVAKKGNFKCNEHQGGNLVYMPNGIIPWNVLKAIKRIKSKLDEKMNLEHSLYALDFIKSNNGNLYFMEGNSGPGIDWDPTKKVNETKSKELIDHIVNRLGDMVQANC
jgi:glutathione synthase/RimK-type ligase-like ATP-grasp enzyme